MATRAAPPVGRYETRGLGTRAQILTADPDVAAAAGEMLAAELGTVDRLASRFRDDSELSLLNASSGRTVPVSADLCAALDVALRAARATGGLVTPTVGEAMIRIGYDRDFPLLARDQQAVLPRHAPVPAWQDIRLDRAARTVRVPAGVLIDLGATAKAWAADRIAGRAAARLGCGVLVSLGGDVAVSGPPPRAGWTIGVADTCEAPLDEAAHVVCLTGGGLATSGTAARRWWRAGRAAHHIVDPATGRPADTCWRSVTVAAGTCVDANIAATAGIVKGPSAPEWLSGMGLPARLVPEQGGEAVVVGGWPGPAGSS